MSDEEGPRRRLWSVPDPEVEEDMRLRTATERDPNRSREMPTFKPARIIGQVPCRARCGGMADWPEEAEHAFVTHNGILAKRDEAPLDKTRIMFCTSCIALGKHMQGDRNRKFVETMRVLIQQLKASTNPPDEYDLIKKLESMGHPDVRGLLESIRASRESKGNKRARANDVF